MERNSEIIYTHFINKDYFFCQGHIGRSDFSNYLNSLPKIDFCYSSLPKPENFSMWYNLADKDKIPHKEFFAGLIEIWKYIDADEYHIEVGKSNKQHVLTFFNAWKDFPYQYETKIYYSAPLNGITSAMAKMRNPTTMLVFSMHKVKLPHVKYSHEYLDSILNRLEELHCFDAVIGKGLLARYCLKYGHSCYGIDMNPDRLKCVYEYLKKVI
jgi:hypothetical protein